MKMIVAVDKEWGIGNKGDLLARVREDLFFFRDKTKGKTVVLGSNTLATFPGGKVLKNRVNINLIFTYQLTLTIQLSLSSFLPHWIPVSSS